jgi:hypothetical protein
MEGLRFYLKNPTKIYHQLVYKAYLAINKDAPWLTPSAVNFLEGLVDDSFSIFEWGSGRSTYWFSKRCKNMTSVEHYQPWHQIVSEKIAKNGIKNLDYKFINVEDESFDQKEALKNNQIPPYVAEIESHTDLDLIVIDGCFRHMCVNKALNKVAPGKYLLIDNSDWNELSDWGVPENWPIVHNSSNGVQATTIWQRPKE